MEQDELLKDEWLRKLVGEVPAESPSDDFTRKVMSGILGAPETVKAQRPFLIYLKTWSPWVGLGLFALVFFFSSDIPYLSFIPGTSYVHEHILPYFYDMFAAVGRLFTDSKTISFTLAVMVAGGLLAIIDWVIRHGSDHGHDAA